MQNYVVKFAPGDLVFWQGKLMEVHVVVVEHFLHEPPEIRYAIYPPGGADNEDCVVVFSQDELEAFGA